jgi:hypothetical protein
MKDKTFEDTQNCVKELQKLLSYMSYGSEVLDTVQSNKRRAEATEMRFVVW